MIGEIESDIRLNVLEKNTNGLLIYAERYLEKDSNKASRYLGSYQEIANLIDSRSNGEFDISNMKKRAENLESQLSRIGGISNE